MKYVLSKLLNMNKLNIFKDKIIVVSASVDQPENIINAYFSMLSESEKERVNRYKFKILKSRQIISIGLLRSLISKFRDCRPEEIIFFYNEFGKPFVSPDADGNNLSFNLSHSDNIAIFVFSRNKNVGIDIEKVAELADMNGVVDLCFSESEKKWFNKLLSTERKEIFYKMWTSKEAYIKAIGKGLSFSPNRISLDRNLNGELFISKIAGDEDFSRCKIISFKPYPGFISSAIIESDSFGIEYFNIDPPFFINQEIHLSGKKWPNNQSKSFLIRN